MTPITATLHDSATIRLDFAFDKDVNAKIKTIPGWAFVADGAFWTVPIRRLDELVKAFSNDLAIDADVLDAKMESDMARVRVFVGNLLAAGISLDVLDGRVTGSGGAYCADPWQREIDARAPTIVMLGLQHSHAPAHVCTPAPAPTHAREATGEELRQVALIVDGMHNAQQNQYAEDAMRKAVTRRRRAKVTS